MANRVLFGPFGSLGNKFRVSRPGYDVTAALTVDQLSFDSDWLALCTVLQAGTATCSSDYIAYGWEGFYAYYYRLVTFPSPGFVPLAIVWTQGVSDHINQSMFIMTSETEIRLGYYYDRYTLDGTQSQTTQPTGTFCYMLLSVPVA